MSDDEYAGEDGGSELDEEVVSEPDSDMSEPAGGDDDDDDDVIGGSRKKKAAPKGKAAAGGKGGAKGKAAAGAAVGSKRKAAGPPPKTSGAATKGGKGKAGAAAAPVAAARGKAGAAAGGAGAPSSVSAAALGTGDPGVAAAAALAGRKVSTEGEAKALLVEYLRLTNRPFSAINIFDNLHGAVGKATLPRLLDALSEEGTICGKLFGKFKVYWPDQKQYGDITQEQLADMQGAGKELEIQLSELTVRRKALSASLSDASASMTTSEIRARLAAVKAEVAEGRAKLDKLKSSTTLVTPAQRAAAVATLERYRKAWSSRKGMVMEVVNAMAEGMDKRPRDVFDMVGVDSDEAAKVNIKDFVVT